MVRGSCVGKLVRLFYCQCSIKFLLSCVIVLQIYLLLQNYQISLYLDTPTIMKTQVHFKESIKKDSVDDSKKEDDDGSEPVIDYCKPVNHRLFPVCLSKYTYIKAMHSKHCFKDVHGVDGSECSILRYLREVEPFCVKPAHHSKKTRDLAPSKLEFREDLEGLLKLLAIEKMDWIRQRARHIWPFLMEALKSIKTNKRILYRRKRKIFFFLGSMGFQPSILENAGHGGFVGELIQWTDLIATTYVLGHNISLALYKEELPKYVLADEEKNCASKRIPKSHDYDLIFTDVNGNALIRMNGPSNHARYRCKIRVLDSFGTEAEFNHAEYDQPIEGGRSPWGNADLLLQQFMTYFPHSPDNTFLGFIAGNVEKKKLVKKDQALIYGKLERYLDVVDPVYLETIKDYFEIHATFAKTETKTIIPNFVINHGVMTSNKLKKLLEETKLFIGLGFPYEGPGSLEAVANGAVFFNPKFTPAKNKLTDQFFGQKPTLRKVTSQNPYMEDFVGKPYVYTIDPKDTAALREALQEIKSFKNFEAHLPREFTAAGMLERVHSFIEHQNLCDPNAKRWPPLENMEVHLAPKGVSCKDSCRKRGGICEATYFSDINHPKSFKRVGLKCEKIFVEKKIQHPSYNPLTKSCFLQDHFLYFSCTAVNTHLNRLCPCRDFVKGQTALCNGCL